jgi:hypothetical protein
VDSSFVRSSAFGDTAWIRFSTDTRIKSIRAVKLGYLPDFLDENEELTVNLPDSKTLFLQKTQTMPVPSGYGWVGQDKFENGIGLYGYENGYAVATFYDMVTTYHIYPVDQTYQIMIEYDQNQNTIVCGNSDPTFPISASAPDTLIDPMPICLNEPAYDITPCIIRVQLLFPQEAITYAQNNFGPWFFNTIGFYTAFQEAIMNMAMQRSDIPNKSVDFVAKVLPNNAGVLTQPPVIDDDLTELFNYANLTYRQANAADLVVLIRATSSAYGASGKVRDLLNGPNISNAHAVVNLSSPTTNPMVLQHELGHLLCCRHNLPANAGDDSEPVCQHGKRHFGVLFSNFPANSWATIVTTGLVPGNTISINGSSYVAGTSSNIPNFSNPDVLYQLTATGFPDNSSAPSNNARKIRNTGCAVSNYVVNPELIVTINASQICGQPVFYANVVSPPMPNLGQGPYHYSWSLCTNVVCSNSVQVGNNSSTLYLPNPPGCKYWVRLNVISSDGVSITRILLVDEAIQCPGGCSLVADDRAGAYIAKVFPNPTFATCAIPESQSNGTLDAIRAVEIFDTNGISRLSYNWNKVVDGSIDVSSLPEGVYFVRVKLVSGHTNLYSLIKVN